jgi:hypothetical protein
MRARHAFEFDRSILSHRPPIADSESSGFSAHIDYGQRLSPFYCSLKPLATCDISIVRWAHPES